MLENACSCPLPFSSIGILADGRSILCCRDWTHPDFTGDLSTHILDEIWNGERINIYRKLLINGEAKKNKDCRECSLSRNFWQG